LRPGPCQTCPDPFLNPGPLELRDRPENVHLQLAGGRRGMGVDRSTLVDTILRLAGEVRQQLGLQLSISRALVDLRVVNEFQDTVIDTIRQESSRFSSEGRKDFRTRETGRISLSDAVSGRTAALARYCPIELHLRPWNPLSHLQ
jgi:hypothetical protein